MRVKEIVALVNMQLAGEQLIYSELKQFLDHAIDDINAQLSSKYPTFTELGGADVDYNMFPDKYIRSVVVFGAAWYYYVADEEGNPTALQYSADYSRGLFIMLRDMLYNVPVQYQEDSYQGTVKFEFESEQGIGMPYGIGEW